MNGLGDLALILVPSFYSPFLLMRTMWVWGRDRHLESFLLISQSVNNYLSLAYSVPGMC